MESHKAMDSSWQSREAGLFFIPSRAVGEKKSMTDGYKE